MPPFLPFSDYYYHYQYQTTTAMLVFLVLIAAFTVSLSFLSVIVFSLYSRKFRYATTKSPGPKQLQKVTENDPLPYILKAAAAAADSDEKAQLGHDGSKAATEMTRSIVLEVLPSDSPKCGELFKDEGADKIGSVLLDGDEEEEKKKKKKKQKRAKKKRPDPNTGGGEMAVEKKKKEELLCLFPFTTSSSAIQRKIKNQYDQLVKSHDSTGLTLVQVGQFVNCLVGAKKELQHRSEVIQRKFTIAKALLLKADRSSFDRLRKQIYKLELEQKRLEEDAFVYNWLQQQLKLSPAYKKVVNKLK
ncbi:OLC1v1015011C2 [Oldenlandia corymbosa var. corymbosa]|uniref:OLC1v1015011C2 n=1 Tax=Oldenlandia corymbosa var. corymbosa TaxID=529605 RepID=A0AAV1E5X7_OLDCO|nr:OLC1v1015011C2 [Oldenlandia corymbosa var. corymbosa]